MDVPVPVYNTFEYVYVWDAPGAVISNQDGDIVTLHFTTPGTYNVTGYYARPDHSAQSLTATFTVNVVSTPLLPINIEWTVAGWNGGSDYEIEIIGEDNYLVYGTVYATGSYNAYEDYETSYFYNWGNDLYTLNYSLVSDAVYARSVRSWGELTRELSSGETRKYNVVLNETDVPARISNNPGWAPLQIVYIRQPKLQPGRYRVIFCANNYIDWYWEEFEVTPTGVNYPGGHPGIRVLLDESPGTDRPWLSTEGSYAWDGNYVVDGTYFDWDLFYIPGVSHNDVWKPTGSGRNWDWYF
jgi:hypothetical protein